MKSGRSLHGRGSCSWRPLQEVTGRRNITQSKHPRGFLGYRTCKWSDI